MVLPATDQPGPGVSGRLVQPSKLSTSRPRKPRPPRPPRQPRSPPRRGYPPAVAASFSTVISASSLQPFDRHDAVPNATPRLARLARLPFHLKPHLLAATERHRRFGNERLFLRPHFQSNIGPSAGSNRGIPLSRQAGLNSNMPKLRSIFGKDAHSLRPPSPIRRSHTISHRHRRRSAGKLPSSFLPALPLPSSLVAK